MCYAILEIIYANGERSTKNVETGTDLEAALTELRAVANITKIKVFTNTETHERKMIWDLTTHV